MSSSTWRLTALAKDLRWFFFFNFFHPVLLVLLFPFFRSPCRAVGPLLILAVFDGFFFFPICELLVPPAPGLPLSLRLISALDRCYRSFFRSPPLSVASAIRTESLRYAGHFVFFFLTIRFSFNSCPNFLVQQMMEMTQYRFSKSAICFVVVIDLLSFSRIISSFFRSSLEKFMELLSLMPFFL